MTIALGGALFFSRTGYVSQCLIMSTKVIDCRTDFSKTMMPEGHENKVMEFCNIRKVEVLRCSLILFGLIENQHC